MGSKNGRFTQLRKSPENYRPQYPAHHLDRPPATGRNLEDEGLLRISCCTRPPFRNGLDVTDEEEENMLAVMERAMERRDAWSAFP